MFVAFLQRVPESSGYRTEVEHWFTSIKKAANATDDVSPCNRQKLPHAI